MYESNAKNHGDNMNKEMQDNTEKGRSSRRTSASRKVCDPLNEHLINKIKCSISGRANTWSSGSDLMSV